MQGQADMMLAGLAFLYQTAMVSEIFARLTALWPVRHTHHCYYEFKERDNGKLRSSTRGMARRLVL